MTLKPYREISHGDMTYPVYVGTGLLEQIASVVATVSAARQKFIVTSPTIHRLVADRLHEGESPILIGDSEQDKTLAGAERIVTELIRRGAKRDSVVIALGGGVIGDTAGFAASIYLRGVDLIQVPTTLLAQVDSSIGGKVAVNHHLGKNLIGSFYPPRAVLSDTHVLRTLPVAETRSGMFEALKAGVIGDPDLFSLIPAAPVHQIVERAIDVKANIVSDDPGESGSRRLLNYGHTIGHAIETATRYEGVTHGDAIAWGMIGANAIALRRELIKSSEAKRIDSTILSMEPERPSGVAVSEVLAAIEMDKKFTTGKRVMVLPLRIGECVIVEVTLDEIRYGVEVALSS